MRQISDAFAARLAAAETSLCLCWRFERADGEVFGATDHDAELVFEGVSYAPAAGLSDVMFSDAHISNPDQGWPADLGTKVAEETLKGGRDEECLTIYLNGFLNLPVSS
ncbi:MAG: DUF2163 domain-containing protein [Burkholderiales bacterium]|nr:MAG: DUF2163 domain-containing protein [Burkholderiales bacterium]